MSKKFKIFIILSVILNIVLIGIVGGHAYRRFCTDKPKHNIERMNNFIDSTSLSVEQQDELKKQFKESVPPKLHNRKKHKSELDKILSAEEFDADKFKATVDQHHNSYGERKEAMANFIINLATQLNQEERKKLAKTLRRKGRHGKPKHQRN